MPLLSLPPEILILIAQRSESQCDLNKLAQSNSSLYAVLNPVLYKTHVDNHHPEPAPALYWAARNNRIGTIQKLIDVGAGILFKPLVLPYEEFREHPISTAARHNHAETVAFFLDQGVKSDLWDKDENPPVKIAAVEGHFQVVKLYLERGIDVWRLPTPDELQETIKEQFPVDNYLCLRSSRPSHPRHSMDHHFRHIRELGLRNKWMVWTARNQCGLLALAVGAGQEAIVKLLLGELQRREAAGTLDPRDILGYALLRSAEQPDDEHLTKILLEAGADVNWHSNDTTPLAKAAGTGIFSRVELLLDAGADPNIISIRGESALSSVTNHKRDRWQVGKDGRRTVTMPKFVRGRGLQPPEEAQVMSEAQMIQMTRFLLDRGADIERGGGNRALINATRESLHELARFLTDRGAQVGETDMTEYMEHHAIRLP